MNRNFKDYLAESAKKYDFRIKVAGVVSSETADKMKELLEKYQCSAFKKVGVTPIQQLPLDFPKLKNVEVCIYETSVDYPVTQNDLHEYLSTNLGLTKDTIVVRRPGEPLEQYQEPVQERTEALLLDPEYKESPNANFDDYYGEKYNSGFVKELNDILRLQRKKRGEVIPETAPAKYNTDDQNSVSVLKQAEDPRK